MNELDSIISKRGNFRVLDPYFLILWEYPYKIVPIIFSDNKYDEYFRLDNYQNRTTLSKMCKIKVENFTETFAEMIPDDYKYMIICDSISYADKNDLWTPLLNSVDEFNSNYSRKNKNIRNQYITNDKFYQCVFNDFAQAKEFSDQIINLAKQLKHLKKPDLWLFNGKIPFDNLKILDAACDKLIKEDDRITKFSIYSTYRTSPADNADKYELSTRIDAYTKYIGKGRPSCEIILKNLDIKPIYVENFIKEVKNRLTDERIKGLKEFFDDGDRWGWD